MQALGAVAVCHVVAIDRLRRRARTPVASIVRARGAMLAHRKRIWVVAADASRARIYGTHGWRAPYELVAAFDHAASRAKVHDLVTDDRGRKPVGALAGRVHGRHSGTAFGRPGAQPEIDAKEHEAITFAKELARGLDRGCEENAYDELLVIAPSHFLGLLRANLHPRTRDRVRLALDKDYAGLQGDEFAEHVRAIVMSG